MRLIVRMPRMDELQEAAREFEAGRLNEAKTRCERMLAKAPSDPRVLHLLGLVYGRAHRPQEAESYLAKAAQLDPSAWPYQQNLGHVYRELGRDDESAAAYERVLSLHPRMAEAHYYLGMIRQRQGRMKEAIVHYHRTTELEPDLPQPHYNLGFALATAGDLPRAEAATRRAIQLDAGHGFAHLNLGKVLGRQRRHEEASKHLQRAIELMPDCADAHDSLGVVRWQQQRYEEAADAFRRSLQLDPNQPTAYTRLGLALEKAGQRVEAADVYRQALQHGYAVAEARYFLAALSEGEVPPAAPPAFVAGLFDGYAAGFDQHLVDSLHYRTPELLHDATAAFLPAEPIDILDLGCGTGLGGEAFKQHGRTMSGIDLSSRMIEKATERGIYQNLKVGDLSEALREQPNAFDLILAVDVFVYIGDLDPVFRDVTAALRAGGIFAFSVEINLGERYTLQPSRRYAHSQAYVREVSAAHGFEGLNLTEADLRIENEEAVRGYIVVLRKSRRN
jgi:predicted TPR repeat methyltransferase